MEKVFDRLIPPMKRLFVVDLLAELLASERDNQIDLAIVQGKKVDWIRENIDFDVKNHEMRAFEAGGLPAVYLYFDRSDYENHQTMAKLPSRHQFIAELLVDASNTSEDDNLKFTGSELADIRLEYLSSQVIHIFMSEAAENIRRKNGISSMLLKSDERTLVPNKDNVAEDCFARKITFEVEFDDNTQYLTGKRIKEIYIENQIRDERIPVLISGM